MVIRPAEAEHLPLLLDQPGQSGDRSAVVSFSPRTGTVYPLRFPCHRHFIPLRPISSKLGRASKTDRMGNSTHGQHLVPMANSCTKYSVNANLITNRFDRACWIAPDSPIVVMPQRFPEIVRKRSEFPPKRGAPALRHRLSLSLH